MLSPSPCGVPPFFPRNATLCPNQPGSDANFGMAPAFVPASVSGLRQDIVVAGQKNGLLYAFCAQDGSILWSVLTSPASPFAGLSWGVAADDHSVYFTGINALGATFQLQPSGKTINNSAFGAADLKTGKLLWETQASKNSVAQVPPTVVSDLILVGRTGSGADFENSLGGLVALNKYTGETLLDIDLNANFHGGIAVANEFIMLGSGYAPFMGYFGQGSMTIMRVAS